MWFVSVMILCNAAEYIHSYTLCPISEQLTYRGHSFLSPHTQKLLKSIMIFQSYDHKCAATFLCDTVYTRFKATYFKIVYLESDSGKITRALRTLNVHCTVGGGDPETLQVSWNDSLALTVSTLPGPHSPRICGATATSIYTKWFKINPRQLHVGEFHFEPPRTYTKISCILTT